MAAPVRAKSFPLQERTVWEKIEEENLLEQAKAMELLEKEKLMEQEKLLEEERLAKEEQQKEEAWGRLLTGLERGKALLQQLQEEVDAQEEKSGREQNEVGIATKCSLL